MGGDGTIGGGGRSCLLNFTINGVETRHADHKAAKAFDVKVTFPGKVIKGKVVNGKMVVTQRVNASKKIGITWPKR